MTPSVHLLELLLERLRRRVAAEVSRFRSGRASRGGWEGLFISDDEIDRILAARPRSPDTARLDDVEEEIAALRAHCTRTGAPLSFDRVCALWRLDEAARELLLVSAAPDLDEDFGTLFAYLHDNSTRRAASLGLASRLVDVPRWALERSVLGGSAHVTDELVDVEGTGPLGARAVTVDPRILSELIDPDPPLDPRLNGYADLGSATGGRIDLPVELGAWPGPEGSVLVMKVDHPDGSAVFDAVAARAESPALVVAASRLPPDHAELAATVARLRREAVLRDAFVAIPDGDVLAGPEERALRLRTALVTATADRGIPVAITTHRASLRRWLSGLAVVSVAMPAPTTDAMHGYWSEAVDAAGVGVGDGALAELAALFRLDRAQVGRAVAVAASHPDGPSSETLRWAARQQARHGLDELARRIPPRAGWDDLILPAAARTQLLEFSAAVRARPAVLDEWGFRQRMWRGVGLVALFAGPSGTGKTLAAEVIAGDLGLELYAIDLGTVVDKYIGETEKKLRQIFDEAQASNAILFFDEADALMARRSEVRDAHDRYANIEVAYLLQLMESYDGTAILATNLKANLDEAFSRRFHYAVEFPFPDASQRRELWRRSIPDEAPRGDLDVAFLAERFELAGGHIATAALNGAMAARHAVEPIGTEHLVVAIGREYLKLGKIISQTEFAEWYPRVIGRLRGDPA